MDTHSRYAVYYLPPAGGALAAFGAAWLGWDVDRACPVPHPDLGLPAAAMTETPRKYGFHATLKPPFRLAGGKDRAGLEAALAGLAAGIAPIGLEGLAINRLGGFLALTPKGETAALDTAAARIVTDLDPFRAPASADETARRRAAGLTPAQERNLAEWGYPYVLDEFRFHMTLTGRLPEPEAEAALPVLSRALAPILAGPAILSEIALVGQRPDGRFETLHRYALTG